MDAAGQEDGPPDSAGSVDPAELKTVSQVKADHEEALLQVPGVVGVGVGLAADTGQVVIQVYVAELTDRIREALPTSLDGVPVEIVETGEFRAL